MKRFPLILLALISLQGCQRSPQNTQNAQSTTLPPVPPPSAIAPSDPAPAATTNDGIHQTLVTKSFVVTITDNRPEGNVTWDDVKYCGVSRKTGQSIRLTGSDWHTTVPDGSPGRFLGYKFKSGNITYLVLGEGRLTVVRGKSDVLVDEPGTWRD